MQPDDATLLEAIRNLHQDALTAVFDQYAPILYKYALRLCRCPDEADDIVGHVFSELLKHLKKGTGPRDNLRAYLFQVAYHKIVDQARDRQRTTPLDNIGSVSSGEVINLSHEEKEQIGTLDAVIKDLLTPDQRHVILLRFIEDFTLKETAEITGKSINNIKIIQNRAITRLREVMNKEFKEKS
jgi:RNA polymerase sigma-70 factor (ECF subfamily)